MIVDCAVYERGQRRPGDLALEDAFEAARAKDALVWIGLHTPTAEEFDSVRQEFELHELAVEDAVKAHQRPKLELYGDSLFLVLKTARYSVPERSVEFGEILVFIGDRFVISVRHGDASPLAALRRELEHRPELLRCGPGAVLHAIVDRVVDDYQPVIEALDDEIGQLEASVFSESRENPAERIYKLTRETLAFHRAVAPLVEPLDRLAGEEFSSVDESVRAFFRDVFDHTVRVEDEIEAFRQLLTGMLEANLTQVSVRQNEDMRRISAWVAIIAVPTMIAGVYGMNFEHMPELEWTYGYPLAIALMGAICTILYRRFRRAGWL